MSFQEMCNGDYIQRNGTEAIRCSLVTNGETADKEDKFLRILILAEDLELCCPLWYPLAT